MPEPLLYAQPEVQGMPPDTMYALMVLAMMIGLHLSVATLTAVTLTRRVLPRLLLLGLLMPASLVVLCFMFPLFNLAFQPFEPHQLSMLYVVGNRVAPDFVDGDVMITSHRLHPLAPDMVVLQVDSTRGGFAFDGLKTVIRLRRVLVAGPGPYVTLAPTLDNSGKPQTGSQKVPLKQVAAKAVVRFPGLALPLRWTQRAIHAAKGALLSGGSLEQGLKLLRLVWSSQWGGRQEVEKIAVPRGILPDEAGLSEPELEDEL